MKVCASYRKRFLKFSEKVAFLRPKYLLFMSLMFFPFKFLKRLFKELCFIFPIVFLIILFINLFFPKSVFIKIKEDILSNPKNSEAHLLLGQQFFSVNDYDQAEKEFFLAQNSSDSLQLSLAVFMMNQPDNIKKNILYWQKLAEEIPTYRDAYIKLYILNEKIYRDFDAKKFLQKALEIDPNNSLIGGFGI